MGIITKKIKGNLYAYLVIREGRRIVHKYIGAVNSPKAAKIAAYKKEVSSIPERFRSLFWDTSLKRIHIKRNARYIIERILELGDIEAFEWLQKVYPADSIIDVLFLSRALTEKSRNFWLIWFGVSDA